MMFNQNMMGAMQNPLFNRTAPPRGMPQMQQGGFGARQPQQSPWQGLQMPMQNMQQQMPQQGAWGGQSPQPWMPTWGSPQQNMYAGGSPGFNETTGMRFNPQTGQWEMPQMKQGGFGARQQGQPPMQPQQSPNMLMPARPPTMVSDYAAPSAQPWNNPDWMNMQSRYQQMRQLAQLGTRGMR